MRIGKLIAATAGIFGIIIGFALSVGGGLALAVPDDDGWVSVGPARVRSDAAALVGDDIHIDLGDHVADGRTFISWDAIPAEITVDGRNDKDVFIGVGPSDAVADYLRGASIAYAEWHDHDFDVESFVPGGAAPLPGDQEFWVASSTDGILEWDVGDGEWAVVVLNADGSPGIDVAVTGAAKVPFIGAIGVGLLTAGILFLGGGIWLTYLGVRAVRPRATAAVTPPAVPTA